MPAKLTGAKMTPLSFGRTVVVVRLVGVVKEEDGLGEL